jgi:hypothetical protein
MAAFFTTDLFKTATTPGNYRPLKIAFIAFRK